MDDLVQFLRARLDEDEQIARGAGGRWMVLPVTGWIQTAPVPQTEWQPPGSDHHVATAPLESDRAHIVRHDPARVLAEVDAKRRMVDASPAHCPAGCRDEHSFSGSCDLRAMGPAWEADGQRWVHDENGAPVRPPHTTEWVLRLLALPHADHPEYRDEWRP